LRFLLISLGGAAFFSVFLVKLCLAPASRFAVSFNKSGRCRAFSCVSCEIVSRVSTGVSRFLVINLGGVAFFFWAPVDSGAVATARRDAV